MNDALLDGLVQLSFGVQAVLGRVAERHDLSLAQVRLLGILRGREPGMLELADYLRLDKSSITGLVGRAEERGFVRRSPSPDDRRAVRVSLTAKGRELARTFAKQVAAELETLVEGWSEADRKKLTALAERVVEAAAGERLALLG
ncbi:MAG TPA: MarR family transcriptional regulator [Polyangiaceae bacterium]